MKAPSPHNRRQSHRVVVDLRRRNLALALAETAGEAVRFHDITRIDIPDHLVGGDQTELDQFCTEALHREIEVRGWQGLPTVCLLSGEATSTQSFPLPDMPRSDLRRAIELRLADTLHFDVEDAVIDFRRLPGAHESGAGPMLVAAARRDATERAIALLRSAQLRPVAVGAAAESLARLSVTGKSARDREATIHVTIGARASIINLFEGRCLRFSREIETSFSSFVEALTRPILLSGGAMQLEAEQARKLLAECGYPEEGRDRELSFGISSSHIQPLLEPIGQRLSAELERSIDYLCGLLSRTRVHSIVLSGAGASLVGLDRMLKEQLRTPVFVQDPVAEAVHHWRLAVCGDAVPSELSEYAAILGTSLGKDQPINLLPPSERLNQQVESITRVRRHATVPLLALVTLLSASAWPVFQTFREADELATGSSEGMERRLSQLWMREQKRQALENDHHRLVELSGAQMTWQGLFQELSMLVPEQIVLDEFNVIWEDGAPQLTLTARYVEGEIPFGPVASQFSSRLANSPFFLGTAHFEAQPPGAAGGGSLEAGLPIAAWSPLEASALRSHSASPAEPSGEASK